jgi:hypothetical protein
MIDATQKNKQLWLLKGAREVPGWGPLETDARAEKIDVVIFDRGEGWALISAETAPTGYEGMTSAPPRNGLYVSESGYPIYVVDCRKVPNAKAVIQSIGEEAEALLRRIGDPDAVLQQLGYAY